MTPMELFLEYFNAFELTYVDDDWSRLEPLFSPSAVYRIRGSGSLDADIEGREAIFAAIRRFLDGFDRQCSRELRSLSAPVVDGNTVSIDGVAAYRRGDSPELLLKLVEEIEFHDGLIVTITDHYSKEVNEAFGEWMARWGQGLNPSYV